MQAQDLVALRKSLKWSQQDLAKRLELLKEALPGVSRVALGE